MRILFSEISTLNINSHLQAGNSSFLFKNLPRSSKSILETSQNTFIYYCNCQSTFIITLTFSFLDLLNMGAQYPSLGTSGSYSGCLESSSYCFFKLSRMSLSCSYCSTFSKPCDSASTLASSILIRAEVFWVSMNALVRSCPRLGSMLSMRSSQKFCSLSAFFRKLFVSLAKSVLGPSRLMCSAICSGDALAHCSSLMGLSSLFSAASMLLESSSISDAINYS